ncbi:MAG: hypothetical protein KAR05_07015 [Candidatus Omnitrophica bacterium]|nr:hypothetical protein [Candidatus Omnitrophota bacterium]
MKNKTKKIQINKEGFSLAELLIASAILIIAVTGILMSYLRCLELNEISRNSSLAVQAGKSRMEQIKATTFSQIKATYDNVVFNISNLNGKGVTYIDDSTSDLLVVTTSISWKLRNGRIFGEDSNLNGQLDMGEDDNGNGVLDSPVLLVTRIFQG